MSSLSEIIRINSEIDELTWREIEIKTILSKKNEENQEKIIELVSEKKAISDKILELKKRLEKLEENKKESELTRGETIQEHLKETSIEPWFFIYQNFVNNDKSGK